MHVFYTPDIQKSNELPEEEAQHCTRVLRLGIGDEITLTDGKGNFYKAEITVATNKRCFVTIKETCMVGFESLSSSQAVSRAVATSMDVSIFIFFILLCFYKSITSVWFNIPGFAPDSYSH